MEIHYQREKIDDWVGLILTLCPLMIVGKSRTIIRVGSLSCTECCYFISRDMDKQTVLCNQE